MGPAYAGAGEIAWGVSWAWADGSLPVPSVYGVPDVWPHVATLYARAGFDPGREETILTCPVADLPARTPTPWTVTRQLGTSGVRFSAGLDGQRLGYLEVDLADDGSRLGRPGRADIGNLLVDEPHRRRGVATALLAEAAWWLRLAGPTNLLTYLGEESPDSERQFYARRGFEVLTRTRRGWTRVRR